MTRGVRVLFATDAGGVGLNLQQAASCCINIELPWNPAVLEQRIGRIYRLGQKRPIDVYNLVSPGLHRGAHRRTGGRQAGAVLGLFDGTSDEVRFERSGSFLSTVQRLVEPAPTAVPATGRAARDTRAAAEAAADSESLGDAAAERELEAMVAAATEPGTEEFRAMPAIIAPVAAPTPAAHAVPTAPPSLSAPEVRALFSQLEIRPTPQGGIRIEATPAAAATLAALFEGLAGVLRASESARSEPVE